MKKKHTHSKSFSYESFFVHIYIYVGKFIGQSVFEYVVDKT